MAELQFINPQLHYSATAQPAERIFHFRANPLGANWGGTRAFETN